MPTTDRQRAQQEKFVGLYFDGPPEFRGNLKQSALAAGYSRTSVAFKQGKLRKIVNAEAQRRGQAKHEENPAATRSPISGKILPVAVALRERDTDGTAGSPVPKPPEKAALPESRLPDWCSDPVNGADQRLYFDHNGSPKAPRQNATFADSYATRYRGFDGALHFAGESVRPAWVEPDFSEFLPEEQNEDPIGDVSLLPQGNLAPDESLSQKILLQAVR